MAKLCFCISLPHSEPMQVPTQVTNAAALARASSWIEQLAEPWVKKVTCCYEYGPFESAIRLVRQHHLGLCMAGMLGMGGYRGQSLGALFRAALDELLLVRLM